MFRMEPDMDLNNGVKIEVVIQYDIKGIVTSAFLNSEYSPTFHLEYTRTEIEALECFLYTYTIYDIAARRDGFVLPFSRDNLTVKFRNNDSKWRGTAFTSIQDRRGEVLETKDITTDAMISVSYSPFLYEMRSKDRTITNRSDYQPDGCSLRMDDIILIEIVDEGYNFESPKKKKKL
jgi:hypothetical protein